MDANRIREWYDRNPIDVVLVVSFSLLLIFEWGQLSSMIGWVMLSAYLIDRGMKHIRGKDSTEEDPEPTENPLQELRSRYARGEISEEVFERKLDRLIQTESVDPTDEHDRELLIEKP